MVILPSFCIVIVRVRKAELITRLLKVLWIVKPSRSISPKRSTTISSWQPECHPCQTFMLKWARLCMVKVPLSMTIRPMELVKFQSRYFDKELDYLVQQIEDIPTKQRWPCDLWSHPLFRAWFTLDLQNHNVVQGDKQLTNVLMIAWPQIKVDHVGVMAFSIGQQLAQQETLNVEGKTFKSPKTWTARCADRHLRICHACCFFHTQKSN